MDSSGLQFTSGLFWIIVIMGYGVFEYKRREDNHAIALLALRYGKEPPETAREAALWQLVTTGSVAALLLAAGIGMLVWRKNLQYGGGFLPFMALVFFVLCLALVITLVRDLRVYRANRQGKEAR